MQVKNNNDNNNNTKLWKHKNVWMIIIDKYSNWTKSSLLFMSERNNLCIRNSGDASVPMPLSFNQKLLSYAVY